MVSVIHILQNPMPSPRQTLSVFRDALRAIGSDSLILGQKLAEAMETMSFQIHQATSNLNSALNTQTRYLEAPSWQKILIGMTRSQSERSQDRPILSWR